jgi:hypothetical protein
MMTRPLTRSGVQLLPVLLGVLLAAGCGGSGSAGLNTAPTPAPAGSQVGGTVFAPNGGHQIPVGRGVTVTLWYYEISGAINQDVAQAVTNDQGQYQLNVLPNTTVDTSRFLVSAGSGASLTRAFVISEQPVDIDYVSEAVVRLILPTGAHLADFSSQEIYDIEVAASRAIDAALRLDPAAISGPTAALVNDQAYAIVADDPVIAAMLDAAAGIVPTPTPTPTP